MTFCLSAVFALTLAPSWGCGSNGSSGQARSDAGSESSAGAGGTSAGTGGTSNQAGTSGMGGSAGSDAGGTSGSAGAGGGSGGGTVTVTPLGTVPWLAIQDGSGPWQTTTATTFPVSDSQGRYGIAWACAAGPGRPSEVEIVQATVGESNTVTASCQFPTSTVDYTVSGTVSGIPAGGSAFIGMGTTDLSTQNASSTLIFSLAGVRPGAHTLVAYSLDGAGTPGKIVMQHGVQISHDTSGYAVNLSSGVSFSLGSLSMTGLPGSEAADMEVFLASSGAGLTRLNEASASNLKFPLVPSSLVAPGDHYVEEATGVISTSTIYSSQQTVHTVATPPASTTLQLPSALSQSAGVGIIGGTANVNWGGSVSFAGNGGLTAFVSFVATSSGTSALWQVVATKGWLGSSSSYTFPDLSSTTSWDASWDFPNNQNGNAFVEAWRINQSLPTLQALLTTEDYSTLPTGASLQITMTATAGTY